MLDQTITSIVFDRSFRWRSRGNSTAADGAAKADATTAAAPTVVAEALHRTASSRRGAALPTGSIFWHLLSVGVVAGATIGVFYGIGFSLLRQPAREPLHSAVAVPHAGPGEIAGIAAGRLGGAATPADRTGSGADTIARRPPAGIPDQIEAAEPAAPLRRPAVPNRSPVASHLSEAEIGVLLARGDNLLRVHDIASARFFYKWAADLGGGQAALRMAETFDPEFLRSIGARNVSGDPTESRFWYKRARELGASVP